MKRLYAAVALLVFILAFSAFDSFTVCRYADSLRKDIKEVERLVKNEDYENALILSRDFTEKYKKYEIIFYAAVSDEKISELSFSAARITPFIEEQSDELSAEIESICKQIERIKRTEMPYWYNII